MILENNKIPIKPFNSSQVHAPEWQLARFYLFILGYEAATPASTVSVVVSTEYLVADETLLFPWLADNSLMACLH